MPPLRLLLLLVVAGFLVTFVQLGVLRVAFDKLGLSPESGGLLFVATLAGSLLNMPLFSLPTSPEAQQAALARIPPALRRCQSFVPGKTIIAVNVGGCVIPVAFSAYLFFHSAVNPLHLLITIAAVTFVAYRGSFSVTGVGIVMPALIAPLVAAIVAMLLDPGHAPPLAYIGGTLGVLIGADMLRLKDVKKMGEPIASIGGAGTFDGIFLTGILAVLLT